MYRFVLNEIADGSRDSEYLYGLLILIMAEL